LYMYFALVLNSVAFILIGIMAIKGYSLKKKSVLYVAAGALGTLSCILVWVFQNFGFLSLPYSYAILNTIFIYTLFPFSLTFYMASRYSYLFGSMEEEVKLRTNELQQ